MPYTPDELKNLSWYQKLIDEDEQKYLQNKALLEMQANFSGSVDNPDVLIRNQEGTVLLFEDPYTNNLPEDPSTLSIHSLVVNKLKDDENTLNDVLDRDFEEL